jgi:hypothetical protein
MPLLYPASNLLTATDRIGRMYALLAPLVGEAARSTSTTLNDAGVTDGATPGAGGTITLTAVPSDMPSADLIRIGDEWIRYRSRAGAVLTVQERGVNSPAAAHTNGAAVYLPTTVQSEASGLYADLLALGVTYATPISDLIAEFQAELTRLTASAVGAELTTNYLTALEYQHLGVRGSSLDASVTSLGTYAQYQNAATPYSMLYSDDFGRMYWKSTGGTPLPNKTVFAPLTSLATGVMSAGPTMTPTLGTEIRRYMATSSTSYLPGYAGGVLRARCTAAGNGTVILSVTGEGMDTDMDYFGRATLGGDSGTSADPSTPTRTWTGTLDLTAAGNFVELTPGTAGDRILKVTAASRTGGTATTGSFVLENKLERNT